MDSKHRLCCHHDEKEEKGCDEKSFVMSAIPEATTIFI
jgi:hypothetical protein